VKRLRKKENFIPAILGISPQLVDISKDVTFLIQSKKVISPCLTEKTLNWSLSSIRCYSKHWKFYNKKGRVIASKELSFNLLMLLLNLFVLMDMRKHVKKV
jgi:hypothetical protein